MSISNVSNPPVEGGKVPDLLFLISLLNKEDKIEFVTNFADEFEKQVDEGRLSKTAFYKFLRGYAPSDDRVLEIVESSKEARRWLIERVKEKVTRAMEIIQKLEGEK